jgi:hypothetical protein
LIRMVLKNHGSKKEMFKTSGGNILHHTYWKHNETIRFITEIMVIGDGQKKGSLHSM